MSDQSTVTGTKASLSLNLRQKLAGFAAVLVLSIAVIGAVGYGAAARLTTQLASSAETAAALRNHLESDMMHDAIRGDVLWSLREGPAVPASVRKDIEDAFAEHVATFRDRVEANKKLDHAEAVDAALRSVGPLLDAYAEEGRKTIGLAFTDTVAADKAFESFIASFELLEEKMGEASDRIEAAAKAAHDHGESLSSTAKLVLVLILLVAIGFAGACSWLLIRQISTPLAGMACLMVRLAEGDSTVDIPSTERTDEIGEMARAVQCFKDNAIENRRLQAERAANERRAAEEHRRAEAEKAAHEAERRAADAKAVERQREVEARAEQEKRTAALQMADRFEAGVMRIVEQVASASGDMQVTAQSMSGAATQTSQQAGAVSAASGAASGNVQRVAGAAEELSRSIAEIAQKVNASSGIASRAASEAEQTNRTVQGLAEAARKIGDVVQLISDIASQTNLLALNATIEASRAGEAGRGFAVVATEVKSLAGQTSRATEEISSQVAAIREVTEQAVRAIEEIGVTIGDVNAIARDIAGAVETQDAATRNIIDNVRQAAQGTEDVNVNIGSVTEAAGESGKAAEQVLAAARALSEQSTTLRDEVSRFLSQVRAA
jgi:methyl-accepting chemotaxis protein